MSNVDTRDTRQCILLLAQKLPPWSPEIDEWWLSKVKHLCDAWDATTRTPRQRHRKES